jgi:hypothetical protein
VENKWAFYFTEELNDLIAFPIKLQQMAIKLLSRLTIHASNFPILKINAPTLDPQVPACQGVLTSHRPPLPWTTQPTKKLTIPLRQIVQGLADQFQLFRLENQRDREPINHRIYQPFAIFTDIAEMTKPGHSFVLLICRL